MTWAYTGCVDSVCRVEGKMDWLLQFRSLGSNRLLMRETVVGRNGVHIVKDSLRSLRREQK